MFCFATKKHLANKMCLPEPSTSWKNKSCCVSNKNLSACNKNGHSQKCDAVCHLWKTTNTNVYSACICEQHRCVKQMLLTNMFCFATKTACNKMCRHEPSSSWKTNPAAWANNNLSACNKNGHSQKCDAVCHLWKNTKTNVYSACTCEQNWWVKQMLKQHMFCFAKTKTSCNNMCRREPSSSWKQILLREQKTLVRL